MEKLDKIPQVTYLIKYEDFISVTVLNDMNSQKEEHKYINEELI